MPSRDESVQFSLKELMKLEDERLAEQSREQEARATASLRTKEVEERQRREEREAKERAELDALHAHQKKELDELAQREAMQKAIVEQSRLEVEVRARNVERDRERHHEIELQRLRLEGSRGGAKLGPLAGAAFLGGGVMLLVMCGIHFGSVKPAADRRNALLEQSVTTAESRSEELSRRADEEKRTIDGLERKLADAQTEMTALKNAASSSPKANPNPNAVIKRLPTTTTTTRTEAPPAAAPPCLKGDPLCPTIDRR